VKKTAHDIDAPPEEALPAWKLTKRDIFVTYIGVREALREYRRRPNPRNLGRVANITLDLYTALKPKIPKIKHRKRYEKALAGIDDYLGELPDMSKEEPAKWVGWVDTLMFLVEEAGITKITLPGSRAGEEMLSGTLH